MGQVYRHYDADGELLYVGVSLFALRRLASTLGATEAVMLAHGFTNTTLDALVRDGLATAERRQCGQGGSRSRLSWLTITDGGRRLPDDRR